MNLFLAMSCSPELDSERENRLEVMYELVHNNRELFDAIYRHAFFPAGAE